MSPNTPTHPLSCGRHVAGDKLQRQCVLIHLLPLPLSLRLLLVHVWKRWPAVGPSVRILTPLKLVVLLLIVMLLLLPVVSPVAET